MERGTISGNLFHLPLIAHCCSQVLRMSQEPSLVNCQIDRAGLLVKGEAGLQYCAHVGRLIVFKKITE